MINPHDAHVDAVRVLKDSLERLRSNLMMDLVFAEETILATPAAVGHAPQRPESARLIHEWIHSLPADIDRIITSVVNINEQCDLYLRGFGGDS